MKKIALSLCMLCIGFSVKAQIRTDGYWYDGSLCYNATKASGGMFTLNAMSEGEELEFMLIPIQGKSGTYHVADSSNDKLNPYDYIHTVVHQQKDGWDVLCFYNVKNQLEAVMQHESEGDSQQLNIAKWKNQIMGEYTDDEDMNLDIIIQWDHISVNGELASFEVITFNGLVTPYIHINEIPGSVNKLEGSWEIEQTLEGFLLHSVRFDSEDYIWVRENLAPLVFKENAPMVPRFAYASSTLLNDKKFRNLDKKALRIMRNEILARYGYRFKSADLQAYFGREPWYEPAANNSSIAPTFLEQLNIDLIKCQEEKE